MNKKEFNISEWLNKKPEPTSIPNENSALIPEIRGGSQPKSVDCCPLSVDSKNSAQIREIRGVSSPRSVDCCPLSVDLKEEIELLTAEIENRALDIAPDYQSWRDLGFALSEELSENGREYYHRISRFYPNYSYENTDKQFTSCLKAHGNGITIKTLFHLAKQAGITIPRSQAPIPVPISPISSKTSTEVIEVLDEIETIPLDQMPTFSDKVRDNLPEFLKKIADDSISNEDADLLILGTLTAVSACMPNIYGIYAGREVFPNLFLFVTAHASAGKGRLSLCRFLVDPIHKQLREEYAVEMEIFKRQQVDYSINKKNPDAEQPVEPPLKTLFIPANSSSTAVYQVLNDNKGVGLIFETEGDTLANTFKSDFGNFSDGFRKAFHHEPISYNRRKDKEFVEIERPKLSALLSGTPRQILSLVPDAENGLFSRFIFYCMNIRLEWYDVFAVQDETLDEHFKNYGREFFDLYRLLKTAPPIRFSFSATQQKEFHSFFEKMQMEYSSGFGIDFVASIRRFGLITFRIAMTLSVLRILENGEFPNVMLCNDKDFSTAISMAETLLKHTAKVYQTFPVNAEEQPIGKNQLKQQYFDALPHDFDKQTALSVAQTLNIPHKTAERYLKQWTLSAQLNHIKHGRYGK